MNLSTFVLIRFWFICHQGQNIFFKASKLFDKPDVMNKSTSVVVFVWLDRVLSQWTAPAQIIQSW